MKTALLIGCGNFMEAGHACPGDFKCFKAAIKGEGKFDEPMQVMGMLKCKCPGRINVPNVMATMKLAGEKPDQIMLSSCIAMAKPECPNNRPEDLAAMLTEKTGIPVVLGTHEY